MDVQPNVKQKEDNQSMEKPEYAISERGLLQGDAKPSPVDEPNQDVKPTAVPSSLTPIIKPDCVSSTHTSFHSMDDDDDDDDKFALELAINESLVTHKPTSESNKEQLERNKTETRSGPKKQIPSSKLEEMGQRVETVSSDTALFATASTSTTVKQESETDDHKMPAPQK